MEFGNTLEAMCDYSTASSDLAEQKVMAMDASLKRMEFMSQGLEKYLNEMVMIAQTPKPSILSESTPFQKQKSIENLIISQVNESE